MSQLTNHTLPLPLNETHSPSFANVKKDMFDRALLVFYTPISLYLVEWNGKGFSKAGKTTDLRGGHIAVYGPKGETEWRKALHCILSQKLPGKLLAEISFGDEGYGDLICQESELDRVYNGVPLAAMSGSLRGLVLQSVLRRYDNTFGPTTDPVRSRAHNGKRWSGYTSHDFVGPDNSRNEVKSAQFRDRCWGFRFQGVKRDTFDRCHLVCYTPYGLYMGEWNGKDSFRTSGKYTSAHGGYIQVDGPYKCFEWQSALAEVLRARFPGTLRAFLPWWPPLSA